MGHDDTFPAQTAALVSSLRDMEAPRFSSAPVGPMWHLAGANTAEEKSLPCSLPGHQPMTLGHYPSATGHSSRNPGLLPLS